MSEINEVIANKIKSSSIVPDHLRKEGELLAAMLFVQELGLPIMSRLQNISVIKGKPTLNSHLLWALVMKQPDLKKVEIKSDEKGATVKIEREKSTFENSVSLEDAKKARLIKPNSGWEKYLKKMCEARAKSLCARLAYPEAVLGIYSTEELQDAPSFNNYENNSPIETKAKVTSLEGTDAKRKEELELKKQKRMEALTKPLTDKQYWEVLYLGRTLPIVFHEGRGKCSFCGSRYKLGGHHLLGRESFYLFKP